MKCFLVISVLLNIWAIITAHPSRGAVEIEKQRLIKFPDDAFQYQTIKQSDETRRILEEINKININLGYVKKQEQQQQQQKMPTILNSDQYLYPRPAYHPAIHGGVVLPPSIRNLRYNRRPINRSQYNYRANYSPLYQYNEQQSENYYPNNVYLKVPIVQAPRNFYENFSDGKYEIEELNDNNNDDYINFIQNLPKTQKLNNMYKIHLVGDFQQFMKTIQERQNKLNKENYGKNGLPLIFLPGKLKSYEEVDNEWTEKKLNNIKKKTERQRVNNKIKEVQKPNKNLNNNNKAVTQQSQKLLTDSQQHQQQRLKFGIFNRPPQQQIIPTTAAPPLLPIYQTHDNSIKISNIKESDDYDSNEDSSENSESHLKFLLAQYQKDKHETQTSQALKDGGIIIQRLKVRKGGIAIAGPGGVATAGSGGTAIVGPGGFALTHPKSLTIAGPGAKVIAYPETVNLGEAALRTNSQNIPEGGKIVATGPTIYYNPATIYQTGNIQTWPLYALPFPQLPVIQSSQLTIDGQRNLQNQILHPSILQNSEYQQAILRNQQVTQSLQIPIIENQQKSPLYALPFPQLPVIQSSQLTIDGQRNLQNQILHSSILQNSAYQEAILPNQQVRQSVQIPIIDNQQKSQAQILLNSIAQYSGQQQTLQYPGNFIPLSYAPLQFYQSQFGLLPEQIPTNNILSEKTAKKESEPTTQRPNNNEEMITSRPGIPEKLTDNRNSNIEIEKSVIRDLQYLSAIQQPNKKFIIDRIIPVPGTRLFQITTLENDNQQVRSQQSIQKSKNQKLTLIKPLSQKLIQSLRATNNIDDTTVKVEVTGHTASDQPVTDIPIGAYFVPYFGGAINENNIQQQASLILEPQAKSIAGNGGTAISAPISRAILKKGINTRVFFRPQSVAIAGAGGTAHAQADLILDYVNK